ncbi:MAG TPA: hypothetical protein VGD42_05605 [Lysobacter sp.]
MEDINPYRRPAAVVMGEPTPLEGARLYKVSGIGLATFMGSVLAGGWLIARNYRALGEPDKANRALMYAVLAMLVVTGVALLLPDGVPGIALTVPQILATMHIARQRQGGPIARYQADARTYSNWRAFGVSLLVVVLLIVVAFAVVFPLTMAGLIE